MKSRPLLIRIVFMGFMALMILGNSGGASAATQVGAGNGLRVSPVRTDATISPGQLQTINITVNNLTGLDATFQVIVNDFTANPNESGDPALLVDSGQVAPKHSLKRFVQPVPNFTLRAGEQKIIPVTIKVPVGSAGGGYYGAIRFAPANSETGSQKTVTLAGSVGSLVLIRVPGDIKEHLSIVSFDMRREDQPSSFFTTSTGINAVVRFQNQGNIQQQPFGKILIKDRKGKTVGTYEVNNTTPRGNVLPDSIRKFAIPLKGIGAFGQYKAIGNFGFGSDGQLLTASTTFYVFPKALILIFAVIVLALAFLIFGVPRLVRSYNRRIIDQARRRKK